MSQSEYIVELRGITKKFPGVVALRDMSIAIRPGEIHGLIGENGAGKSTLIKVLTGVHRPNQGEIYIRGEQRKFSSPTDSREAGIACVYQELNIVKLLSVTDNVFMGHTIKKKSGLLDYEKMDAEARAALDTLGHPEVDVHTPAGKLREIDRRRLAIARAICCEAQILLLDEPTGGLEAGDASCILTLLTQLARPNRKTADTGRCVIIVTDSEDVADRCDDVFALYD